MLRAPRVFLLCAFLLCCVKGVGAQGQREAAQGSLSELRDKHLVLLLVSRGSIVDTRDRAGVILAEAEKNHNKGGFFVLDAYNTIAKQLNKYMRKHKSLTAVEDLSQAEFVIVFNVLKVRVFTGRAYPYGEMFVIVNNDSTQTPSPHVVWKTRKDLMWAEDAIGDLIDDLKTVRGER